MDTGGGGTDAPLTFTLEGCRGTASVTVHTGVAPNGWGTGRMEQGGTDHVTIPSLNLGMLTKLHIFNDGGFLNFGPWDLQDVAVSSARWLGENRFANAEYRATWNKTIDSDTTAHIDLAPAAPFQEPPPTIQCPAPVTVNNAPGQCNAVVNFGVTADGMCPDIKIASTPKSGSAFDVGTTLVNSTATSAAVNGSASCSFNVTVKDVESPLIACPGPMTVDATGPLGVVVTFAPVAADNCSATTTSVPPSGSVFAIGTTREQRRARSIGQPVDVQLHGAREGCGGTVGGPHRGRQRPGGEGRDEELAAHGADCGARENLRSEQRRLRRTGSVHQRGDREARQWDQHQRRRCPDRESDANPGGAWLLT
jgi:hypothetical protein